VVDRDDGGLGEGERGLRAFQAQIEALYYEKDAARGWEGTFVWFVEEVGELARALHRDDDPANLAEEFADVAAWLVSLASLKGVDMGLAARKYGKTPDA
jgi:NTP pyrophosphatase (non-canonical NTP hydrolase)